MNKQSYFTTCLPPLLLLFADTQQHLRFWDKLATARAVQPDAHTPRPPEGAQLYFVVCGGRCVPGHRDTPRGHCKIPPSAATTVRTPWVITEVSTGGPTNGHDVYPFQRYQRCSRGSWWKIDSKAGALIEFKSPQTSAKSQPLGWKNGLDSPVGMCVTYDCVLNDLMPTAECDGLGDKYCKSFAKDS